jgi:hypothetical protein
MSTFQILANIDKRGLVKYFGSDEAALKRGNNKGTATIFPNHTVCLPNYNLILVAYLFYRYLLRFSLSVQLLDGAVFFDSLLVQRTIQNLEIDPLF